MPVVIECDEHFDRVTHFAVANGCLLKLAERLDYLSRYGDGDCVCYLYPTSVPNSFAFTMVADDGPRFEGALIYSGPGPKHSWSVHT